MQKVTPVFLKGYQYILLIVGTMTGLILATILSSVLYDPPRIDYQTIFGEAYLGYAVLNYSILVCFAALFVIMGLLFGEELLRRRGYHESKILAMEKKETKA